jgi:hypothetical protein
MRKRPSVVPPRWNWFAIICAIALLVVAAGCTRELEQENAALKAENEQLHAEIAATNAELESLRNTPAHLYAQGNRDKRNGYNTKARAAFTDLVALYPNSPEAEEAHDRIAEIDQVLQQLARQREEQRKAEAAKKQAAQAARAPTPTPAKKPVTEYVTLDGTEGGQVVVRMINLWLDPRNRSAGLGGKAPHGTRAKLVRRDGEYALVETDGAAKGWVTAAYFIKEFK